MKITGILAVVFGFAVLVLGLVVADGYSTVVRAEKETESCRAHSKKSLEEQDKHLKTYYGEQIASRDQALDKLERQIWSERNDGVEAIVKAADFRRANPDVPQPDERSVTVYGAEDKESLVFLFPAERKALEAIDSKYKQGIEYLTLLGRVTCKDEPSHLGHPLRRCYGSAVVGGRIVPRTIMTE